MSIKTRARTAADAAAAATLTVSAEPQRSGATQPKARFPISPNTLIPFSGEGRALLGRTSVAQSPSVVSRAAAPKPAETPAQSPSVVSRAAAAPNERPAQSPSVVSRAAAPKPPAETPAQSPSVVSRAAAPKPPAETPAQSPSVVSRAAAAPNERPASVSSPLKRQSDDEGEAGPSVFKRIRDFAAPVTSTISRYAIPITIGVAAVAVGVALYQYGETEALRTAITTTAQEALGIRSQLEACEATRDRYLSDNQHMAAVNVRIQEVYCKSPAAVLKQMDLRCKPT